LKSSVDLGKQLQMSVVAEGPENEEDMRLLEELNVDLAQGYFVSRPMPAEDVIGWVEEWKKNNFRG